ncbi:MAG: 5'-deoxynucleotidase [Clostridia bacterium]|nr:5'-deoxynucleotidase [Clostridia bacterium]
MSKFFAFISRMKFINRWALMRNTSYESLVCHSHEVAVIAHALCIIGNRRFGKNYDADKAAVIALYHDASEIITGDMPTPIKYFNKELKIAYKDVENKANQKLINMLPDDLKGDYIDILFYDENYIKIIKSADKLSALIKCEEELKMGNSEFKKAKETTEKAIKKLNCEEANVFIEEFFPYYSLTLDELN